MINKLFGIPDFTENVNKESSGVELILRHEWVYMLLHEYDWYEIMN